MIAITEDDPTSPDARHCLGEYFRELAARFEQGFDPANSKTPSTAEFVAPHGAFLVMRRDGKPIGCGAFKRTQPHVAYLKRMWIDPAQRGQGLSKRLLQALEDHARAQGCTIAQLETHKALAEAQNLYRAAGYVEIPPFNDEPYADHWFEKPL